MNSKILSLIFILFGYNIVGGILNMLFQKIDGGNTTNVYINILYVFFCFAFIINNKKCAIWDSSSSKYIVFYIYVLFITYYHSLTIGLEKQSAMFDYIQPLLLFCVGRIIKNNDMYKQVAKQYVLLIFFIVIFVFVYSYNSLLVFKGDYSSFNAGYFVLYLFPLCLYFINNKYKIILIVSTILIIAISAKRGALISFVGGLMIYYYLKNNTSLKSFVKYCLWIAGMSILFIVIDESMGRFVSSRLYEIKDDGGSGRTEIWESVWNLISNTNGIEMIIGHGYRSVIRNNGLGYSSHNDYLEVIYDFGWLGFVLMILFMVHFVKLTINEIVNKSEESPILAMSLFIYIMASAVSHIIIAPLYASIFGISWGILLKKNLNNK